jgi:hypothetical protein
MNDGSGARRRRQAPVFALSARLIAIVPFTGHTTTLFVFVCSAPAAGQVSGAPAVTPGQTNTRELATDLAGARHFRPVLDNARLRDNQIGAAR